MTNFAYIEHRFLRSGFWSTLSHDEFLWTRTILIVIVLFIATGTLLDSHGRDVYQLHASLRVLHRFTLGHDPPLPGRLQGGFHGATKRHRLICRDVHNSQIDAKAEQTNR